MKFANRLKNLLVCDATETMHWWYQPNHTTSPFSRRCEKK